MIIAILAVIAIAETGETKQTRVKSYPKHLRNIASGTLMAVAPWETNPQWAEFNINLGTLQNVMNNYFSHPYRYNSEDPKESVQVIAKRYLAREGYLLPAEIQDAIQKSLEGYQEKFGKQTGFKNDRGLVTSLPQKKMAAASNNGTET